jgi:hypothetical protein
MRKSRTVCPRCDSDDVIGDGVESLDAEEVRIGGLCNDCGRTWTIVMHPDVEVVIRLDGGIVRDVRTQTGEHVPATVHDYDIEGCSVDPEDILVDGDGNEYIEWGV